MTNKKFFSLPSQHVQQEIFMTKLTCPTKIFNDQNFMSSTKIHTHTHKKFSMLIKQGLHIPTKFLHPSKMNLFNQAYTTNFHNFNAPKIQDKIHPTIPQITYIAKIHEPPTLPKFHHIQQLNNSKMPQGQDYNIITRISNQTLQCPKFQQK